MPQQGPSHHSLGPRPQPSTDLLTSLPMEHGLRQGHLQPVPEPSHQPANGRKQAMSKWWGSRGNGDQSQVPPKADSKPTRRQTRTRSLAPKTVALLPLGTAQTPAGSSAPTLPPPPRKCMQVSHTLPGQEHLATHIPILNACIFWLSDARFSDLPYRFTCM